MDQLSTFTRPSFRIVTALLLFLALPAPGHSQTPFLDSLRSEMQQAQVDTTKINKGLDVLFALRQHGDTTYLHEIDPLIRASEMAKRYDLMAVAILEKGLFYHLHGKVDSSIALFNRSRKLCEAHQLDEQLGYTLFHLAGVERYESHHQAAYDLYEEAGAVFKKIGMEPQLATITFSQAVILDNMGRFEASTSKFYEALGRFEELKDDHGIGNCRNSLGIMVERTKQYDKALEHYRMALAYTENTKDKREIAKVRDNIGNVHREMGAIDSAMYYSGLALAMRRETGDLFGIGRSLINVAWDQRASNDLLGAEKSLTEAIGIFTQMRNDHSLSIALNRLATVKQEQGDDQKAIDLAKQALVVVQRIGSKNEEQAIQRNLSYIHENAGIYKPALEHYQAYHAIKDSILNAQSLANLNELETKYETAQKDEQLAKQELELEQKEAEVRKRNLLIGLAIAAGLVAALILSLMMRSANQRRKLEVARVEQLEAEKKVGYAAAMIDGQEAERGRIAKELHDGLGALLATAKIHMSKVQQGIEQLEQMKVHEKANDLIETAYTEVRRISHDMMPGSLEKFGLAEALRSLCTSLTNDDLQATFRVEGLEQRLSKSVETTLYRIAQEAANNMLKYAEARTFSITLDRHSENVQMKITDDGKGFDMDRTKVNGLGLQNILSRAGFHGGDAVITSKPAQGTSVVVNIPLSNA